MFVIDWTMARGSIVRTKKLQTKSLPRVSQNIKKITIIKYNY